MIGPATDRIGVLLHEHHRAIAVRTDRLFAGLMLFQWALAMLLALWISPLAWAGELSWPHRHVEAAVWLGGLASLLPVVLVALRPGATLTRHVVAVGQMGMGSLLIHLTGGRIETHFHIFGSLAFLSFYRDWRVLVTGSVVVALDHMLRGIYWPQSVFGVIAAAPWRWLEHVCWVAFCDLFLIRSCRSAATEMRQIAERRAALEELNASIELRIRLRTAELADSEARKAAILDSALDAIVTVDHDLCITEFNPGAERLFARPRAEALRTPLNGLITLARPLPPALREALATLPSALVGQRVEGEGRGPGGAAFPAEVAITAIHTGGPEAWAIHVRDITVSKRAHDATVRAAQAAEAASRAKSEFLANMSHEMRTPLNGILGMAALALESPLQPEQQECLETISASGEALLTVIDDLLDFSRIEAGRVNIEPVVFAVRDLVADQFAMVAPKAADKGLELVLQVATEVPELLHGDAQRLGQVLSNLLGNAVKFTERGDITVEVSAADAPDADRYHLQVVVRDTGIGIPADRRDAVFEPFVQADGSTTRKYGGTGLGLTIARRLVELMGGGIRLDSEVGAGTTITFVVPVDRVHQQAPPPPEPATGLRGKRVLVVDDHDGSRSALAGVLGPAGARCVGVADGDAALAALAAAAADQDPFAAIVLDDSLPGFGGLDLARRIATAGQLAPPIVLLSRSDHAAAAAATRELGLARHLRKPVRPGALLTVVAAAVRATPAATAPVADSPPARRARILVAEDNPTNQRLAERLLQKRGFDVVLARDGLEAQALLERGGFDLVLMDIQMPGRSGIEVTQALRERERLTGVRLPVIAVTAHTLPGDREKFLAAGMDDYVSKPIRATELFAAIDRALAAAKRR